MLFGMGTATIQVVQELIQEKYKLESSRGCSIAVTRKKRDGPIIGDSTFSLRADDCLRISIIQKEELKYSKHGSAQEVLLSLGQISYKVNVTICPKCGDFLS